MKTSKSLLDRAIEHSRPMGTTYKQAGVDIAAGNSFADMIAERAITFGVKTDIGGFAGSFPVPAGTTVCCGAVDGVGTKFTLLSIVGQECIGGIDAAAMAGVDMYVAGNRPIAVFDYLVTEHLKPRRHVEIVNGILWGCQRLGCEFLPGGETAEHPGVGLPRGYVDVAVFVVGAPDPELPSAPQKDIMPGMVIWGWLSGGLGANGYSLARRVHKLREGFWAQVLRAVFGGEYGRFSRIKQRLDKYCPELGCTLGAALLSPTRIYVKEIEALRKNGVQFKGHAHITGGGMPGNIPRILPPDCVAYIDCAKWDIPPIFNLIQRQGKIETHEMYRVFNMGIQMVSVTPRDVVIDHPNCRAIGVTRPRKGDEPQVAFVGMISA